MLHKFIRFFLDNKLVTVLIVLVLVGWGVSTAPFAWDWDIMPRDPVPVDAIPDIGENQQIVFTEWPGRSPQDIEDQITYPLTTALLGIPGVKTIRSNSVFGFSSIYIIFNDDIEFYWSRSRILEKLNSLPAGTVPEGVQPALGPDATALGQIYWYTLEGRDKDGNPVPGWEPQELRTIQDFYVKYALSSAKGVSEVASVGGFVKEYQIDIDPDAMRANNVSIAQIMKAVKNSNLDVGARTIEFNKAELMVRGIGYIKSLKDLDESVVKSVNNVPIRIKDVAKVQFGPATRRGGLDKSGAEAVGGVVVARFGSNPLEVINNVKDKIKEISPGLPSKDLPDGRVSKVTIVPFYDRTGLIKETLGTLEEALSLEILISMLVVIILVMNLRASVLISSLLPIGVLMTFIAMKYSGVDANIVALSGIAIAIGVMVDVGVVFTENVIRHLEKPENKNISKKEKLELVFRSTKEVASAVITALATTVISFLPVFAMQAAEGKLFRPLAFTKTYALLSALFIGVVIIPTFAYWFFSIKVNRKLIRKILNRLLLAAAIAIAVFYVTWAGVLLALLAIYYILDEYIDFEKYRLLKHLNFIIIIIAVVYLLARQWLPLGAGVSLFLNILFVALIIAAILGVLMTVVHFYPKILAWCLANKLKFLSIPLIVLVIGIMGWQGFNKTFGFVADITNVVGLDLRQTGPWQAMNRTFPGIGSEFMPPLDEGSFLLMPTTMPHSGVEENLDVIRHIDMAVSAIPEVDMIVGKWGRVNSALDPAPISMFENTINYKPEYVLDEDGHRMRFKVDDDNNYVRDSLGNLIEDPNGEYFRNWRDHIKSPNDIWKEIVKAAKYPGLTSSPKLQPIQTRLIMLATGMRAPLGLKIFGPDLETIEQFGYEMEKILKQVPSIKSESVFADRVVGKPYLEIHLNRDEMARYGIDVKSMQNYIEVAIGGIKLSTSVEGRERFPIRVRYAREFRDNPDEIGDILIPASDGKQIPLKQLAEIKYVQGPQTIKSEDTFLNSYVIFDKKEQYAEVDVVDQAKRFIEAKIESGDLTVPRGVTYKFAGNYENQLRAAKRLSIVIPISLIAIFLILYFQFGNVQTTTMVFSGVFVAFSGGFIMLWLYSQGWFLNFNFAGVNIRDLFQVHTINASVAVWVGFIALFGVATDDGVIMGTYLKQVFEREKPRTKEEVRKSVLHAGQQRIRPAIMTAATTIIALLPILTSTGKGSDIMVPMAIPTFGGMIIQMMTIFIVPTLYSAWQERKVRKEVQNYEI